MKLKVTDATKEELIQYLFTPGNLVGGYRISAAKEDFLCWLENKRTKDLLKQMDEASEESEKALADYTAVYKKLSETEDPASRIRLVNEAREAFGRHQAAEVKYERLNKKFHKMVEVKK